MEFIDNTGHIFSQPSYDRYPVGYEYETFKYIFYIEDEYVRRLSVDEWYIRPIRFIIHKADAPVNSINIKVDSTVFKLIPGTLIQGKVAEGLCIELDEDSDDFRDTLQKDDLIYIEDDNDILCTFYVAACASEPVTWTSNILIDVVYESHEEWCPITVGGVFYDEREELIINGKNMGVSLPKDILKAVYPLAAGTSVYSDTSNDALYSQKVKEYMMNYMRLHGECGNMDQAKSALEFFEWGTHITLVQLIRTDNDILTQYIRDFFNTSNDILWRMEHFEPSSLLSVIMPLNAETGEVPAQDYDKSFWGEMKPVLEDLDEKMVPVEYDETGIKFYKPWFDYVREELMLKLSCLKHFYQKCFLPMHMMLQSAAAQHRVFANDIKYVERAFTALTEKPVDACQAVLRQDVEFPSSNILYAYTQKHYVDSNFNEFYKYEEEADKLVDTDIFYIDDVCIAVPLKFISDNVTFFRCHLILERLGGPAMFESDFSFYKDANDYKSFIIYPKYFNDVMTMNYWAGKKYCLHLLVNDVWYDWEFKIDVPEMHMTFGKLKYLYDNKSFRQLNGIHKDEEGRVFVDFQSFMYLPSLIDVSNIRFPEEVVAAGHDGVMDKFVSMYHEKPSIPSGTLMSKRYYNRVHYFKLLNADGLEIEYTGAQDGSDAYDTDVINMYLQLFNTDGTQRADISVGNMTYDIYLMHDSKHVEDYDGIIETVLGWKPHWYIVMISRETIDNASVEDDLDAPDINGIMPGYNLQYVKSDNKWLINRMAFLSSYGVSHFKTDDIIVGTINNIELPYILSSGSRWNIKPFSPGMQEDSEVESKTNTFLMSLGGDNTGYDPGYYNITVRYSLDGTVQNQRKHTARILVER